jgi:serine/threonine-protein kinase
MSTDITRIGDDEASERASGVSHVQQSPLGETIDGRYRVDALLGEGGMGLVYRVTHTQLNKRLAIKVLRRENTRDEEVLARFKSEAQSASAIGNEHIVDINDFGVLADGSTYFVMECLEGMDLIEAMDRTPRMPQARAVHIAIQICRALGAAHDAGIVHRDLKPENVFLICRDHIEDFVKVLDFGIAKVANRPTRLTRQGEVLGTPHYMSPEQCEGEDVDHRTDIYALGVLLYEMLTGHVPHDADTMMGILTKHLYEDPIPPRVRVPQVSEALERLIMRCLEKRPERRYQTMSELEADLSRIQSGEQPVGPNTTTLTPTRPPPAPPRGVSPVYLAGLAVALLALVGTLALGSVDRRSEQKAPVRIESPVAESSESTPASIGPSVPRVDDAGEAEVPSADATREPPATPGRMRDQPRRAKVKAPARARPEHDPAILDPWE